MIGRGGKVEKSSGLSKEGTETSDKRGVREYGGVGGEANDSSLPLAAASA